MSSRMTRVGTRAGWNRMAANVATPPHRGRPSRSTSRTTTQHARRWRSAMLTSTDVPARWLRARKIEYAGPLARVSWSYGTQPVAVDQLHRAIPEQPVVVAGVGQDRDRHLAGDDDVRRAQHGLTAATRGVTTRPRPDRATATRGLVGRPGVARRAGREGDEAHQEGEDEGQTAEHEERAGQADRAQQLTRLQRPEVLLSPRHERATAPARPEDDQADPGQRRPPPARGRSAARRGSAVR